MLTDLVRQGQALAGTDKIEPHGYFTHYLRLASQIGPYGAVCEVGVEFGRSLLMWQHLFPLGTVTGVDINPGVNWPEGTHRVVASQDDPELPGIVRAIVDDYDLIVDDASHDGRLSARTFDLLWPLVKPGGWYVLEDWTVGIPSADMPYYGESMLRLAQSFLLYLNSRSSEVDTIEYHYGLAMIHKAER